MEKIRTFRPPQAHFSTAVSRIRENNYQKANETKIWPGVNYLAPEWPFWMLDRKPGLEHFVVITTQKPFDPIKVIRNHGYQALRKEAAPLSRSVCNPQQDLNNNQDPYQLIEILEGKDKIIQNIIVEHV